jgi:hypothetical protein
MLVSMRTVLIVRDVGAATSIIAGASNLACKISLSRPHDNDQLII